MPHRDMGRRLVLIAVGIALSLAACGEDGERPETQPAPDVSSFATGAFDDLPMPPRSEPAGDRTEQDGVVSRSFFVRDTTPAQVLEFYRETLANDDVQVVSAAAPIGPDAWRGVWTIDDRELLVSATAGPTTDDDLTTQFSLRLYPPGRRAITTTTGS